MKKWAILGSIAFAATFFLLQKCASGSPSPEEAAARQEQMIREVGELGTYLDGLEGNVE